MSHVKGDTSIPLIQETIGNLFDKQVKIFGNKPFVTSRAQKQKLSWKELQIKVDEVATSLATKLNLKKGDRLGVWMPNSLEWLIAQLATAKIGVILVTVNPAYRLTELEYALNLVQCKVLLITPKHSKSDYVSMLQDLCPDLKNMKNPMQEKINSKKLPHLEYIVHNKLFNEETGKEEGISIPGMIPFNLLLTHGVDGGFLDLCSKRINIHDPINIQFTSGTTGHPKAATLSHHNILNNGKFVGINMKLNEEDIISVPVPLYHCFGLVMGVLSCITNGSQIVFPYPSFKPLETLKSISEEKCTGIYGVPTMFIAQLNHPDFHKYDMSTLRTGIMAGSPCPKSVMKQVVEEMNCKELTICYGQTETSPVSFQTRTEDSIENRCETVGSIHQHVEVKIVNEKGEVVPINTQGELYTKGYLVMKGYWAQEEKTSETITKDGFLKTGDLGSLDENGFARITGRIKDMIIRGGENIYPREIEEFLFQHKEIQDVSVVGVPDEKMGEQVCAWVIKQSPGNDKFTEKDIKNHCKNQIAHYKIPYYIFFVDSFPQTVTGKIRKNIIRKETIEKLLPNLRK